MHLAILHYHLNRGGVTQSILNHLASLATLPVADRPSRVALVSCGRRDGWPHGLTQEQMPLPCDHVTVPRLEYDADATADPGGLADALERALNEAGFDPSQAVLHTHNHSLGKNASLPGALSLLAGRGFRLLLQVHDFAEDFRPANYRHLLRALRARSAAELAAHLYPQAPGVHYAALTARDRGLLAAAGVASERLHLLPNPVVDFHALPPEGDARAAVRDKLNLAADTRLVVYPVRGIRRKNVGEMLLHSVLSRGVAPTGGGACFAVTLAPENPIERASFDRWQALAEARGLCCRFDIGGRGIAFPDALVACDAILTTSVAEGFGMVFLEAWLAGRPLVGRDLPDITQDFKAEGVRLPGLRAELRTPLDWQDRPRLRDQLQELHSWACRDFNAAPQPDTAEQLERMLSAEAIDFASLPSVCQARVICRAAENPARAVDEMAAVNEAFDPRRVVDGAGQHTLVPSNAARVREAYSPRVIGGKLAAIYGAVMADTPGAGVAPPSSGASILHSLLRIDRLRPVRVEA